MKQRTMKRLGLFLCSCVMATTAAFAAGSLNANEVNANAQAVTPKGTAVGTLGADGLYSTTMKQIAPVGGVAASVQNVYFEGFSEGTFFLTEFTGKNAPNFAIHASKAYDAWNAETGVGTLMLQTYESGGEYFGDVMRVSPQFDTEHTLNNRWETDLITRNPTGKGPGMDYLADDETYVMIVGKYGILSTVTETWEYYLFSLADDGETLTWVTHESYGLTPMTGAIAGSTAVIYPSIGADTNKQISFKYATPAMSVASVAEGLSDSVAYKESLLSLLDNGLTHTSLSRTTTTVDGTSVKASDVDFIELDMAQGNTTYILMDFLGGNAPNVAFNAKQGYSTWNGEKADNAGVIVAPSAIDKTASQGYMFGGFDKTNSKKLSPVSGTPGYNSNNRIYLNHLQNQAGSASSGVCEERYIMILGLTVNESGNETLDVKIYYEYNGTLSPYMVTTFSADYTSTKNSKLVLYGNTYIGNAAIYDPSEVCFRYSQPADSIENLIKGLSNKYEYKKLLADTFDIALSTGSVTVKSEAGETISSTEVNETYTLPTSQTTGFIGYEVGGKLYAAGDVITVNSDVVATEVTLDFAMTAGARVRAKEGDGHYGGLRFETTVSAAKMETWADEIALYGVVIPTDAIDGEFDINEAGSKKVALTNFKAGEKNTYYITLTDVYYYNYNRAFSARAYAEVTYADGDKVQFATAYTEKDNSRSVYEVAKAALADTGYGYTTEQIDFIKKYVNYVVDLTVDGNGNLVLLDNATTTYEVAKSGEGYVVTVKNVPAHLANAGYVPVSVWEFDEEVGGLVCTTKIVAATLTNGNLVSENFS